MMGKKNNHSKNGVGRPPAKKPDSLRLWPSFVRSYLTALVLLLLAAVVTFSFFGLAGSGGQALQRLFFWLLGDALFLLPLFLGLAAAIFLFGASSFPRFWRLVWLALFSCLLGSSAILASLGPGLGGELGRLLGFLPLKFFGFWINLVVFGGLVSFGFLIFWKLAEKMKPQTAEELMEKPSILRQVFEPKLSVKPLADAGPIRSAPSEPGRALPELKSKTVPLNLRFAAYQKPPLDLLEADRGTPTTGDIRNNLAIIKKTLETFAIPVEMGEVSVGPTVTQYTFKPAEGIKLSKITTLNNDLSLALAAHPLRIEAPIPGKALVGVEVPNRTRTQVRLRNIFQQPEFRESPAPLLFALGRDVAGQPSFADLTRMPHLLVAGATGTGKTICLNSLILSLIFRNSPEILRLILIDPKRVEFPVYEDLPHLLSSVIFDSQRAVNVLKWLVKEMERRFEVLAGAKARDIGSFNRQILEKQARSPAEEEEELELMPYIVVIVDELADLMASRGKEIEGGIVRLAQMARAVGIHLIVATQRPSVEVITGLIKANITSRLSFQVASQVDSRTVLDAAGAEKLLGSGDLLFISAETSKPRRLQGAYVTDKEVKRVIDFLKGQQPEKAAKENYLSEELEKELEVQTGGVAAEQFLAEEDPLYLSAKQLVIESRKASASLLQRRLRVGYARAARLLDILEERGVIGPGEGAKPREVFATSPGPAGDTGFAADENHQGGEKIEVNKKDRTGDDWQKV